MLFLEKYSTDNKTYLIVPKGHTTYDFPYNIKDRVEYVKNKLKNYKIAVKKEDNGIFDGIRNKKYPKYIITSNDEIDKDLAEELKFKKDGKKFILIIE